MEVIVKSIELVKYVKGQLHQRKGRQSLKILGTVIANFEFSNHKPLLAHEPSRHQYRLF